MHDYKIEEIFLSFWDWKRQWLQFFSIIIIFSLAFLFDVYDLLYNLLLGNNPELKPYLHVFGKFGICLIFTIIYDVKIIYKWNEGYILNRGGIYHKHSYLAYYFCAGILGYKKCNLRLVPIYLQFKLIINGIFDEYIYSDGIHKAPYNEGEAEIYFENELNYTQKINLILIDTYSIQKGQLPAGVLNLTSIYIERCRDQNDNVRYTSEKFVNKVLNTIRQLPNFVTEINIFATLNPENCYNIVKEIFSTGGRDNIKHLWVYQQSREAPRHFIKPKKIF